MAKEIPILDQEILKRDTEEVAERCSHYLQFYKMDSDQDLKEVTPEILRSPHVKEEQKANIKKFNRRIFIFKYPSDGLTIKAVISFVPDAEKYNLLCYLRGGNREFGIINPGGEMICYGQNTAIATTYRGGVSEGEDQYGGDDVNDVKNLIDFLPKLEEKLGIKIQINRKFAVGVSRGGMQLFLTLARYPELQKYFSKVISISGLVDLRYSIKSRPDMEEMLKSDFGLRLGENEEEWYGMRDPMNIVDKIEKQLPILIIQGTSDCRTPLEVGYNFVKALQDSGNKVEYWEIPGADHCLYEYPDREKIVIEWLEDL